MGNFTKNALVKNNWSHGLYKNVPLNKKNLKSKESIEFFNKKRPNRRGREENKV